MKPQASPLQILDFAITQLEFHLVPPEDVNEDPTQYFRRYDLDIDFGISTDDFIKAYIKAEINLDDKLPGYSILAEAACIFQFDQNTGLPEDVRKSMEGFSTIYIALNSLRGLISNFTANAPFGRYILPSIDLNDLIEKKKEANIKKVSKKTTGPKRVAAKKSVKKK